MWYFDYIGDGGREDSGKEDKECTTDRRKQARGRVTP
jgi:hypothetical protein